MTIWRQHRHTIPFVNPQLQQPVGQAIHPFSQGTKRITPFTIDNCRLFREQAYGTVQEREW
jgi:hypothetical protein